MSDTARTDEAPGSVEETLLIHRLPDAGTTIERRFHPRSGTETNFVPLTRRWNVETIAAVSTTAANDAREQTGRNLRTLAAMIKVRFVRRRPVATKISQTLSFAVPLQRSSPRIA